MLIKNSFIALLLILGTFQVVAQNSSVKVIGRVVDLNSSKPLDFATVAIIKKGETVVLAGGITDSEGMFSVKSPSQDFFVEVSFLGYNKLIIDDFIIKGGIARLETIKLSPDQELLSEVTVRAEKSRTTFELDKRVFNVGQDLSSAGGSALDILNNVPSVDVNIEGAISLRGNSNVQILVNGKPSVMVSGNTLGTIAAEMIEKVEVITNPSAKYDAEGTTGIINIILKKEDREGVNGAVTLNAGSPTNHSIGLSLNRRTEKFNLFSQFGVGKRKQVSTSQGLTLDRTTEAAQPLHSNGTGDKNEEFYNIILGTDYQINSLNAVTLTGHYAYEFEDEFSGNAYDLFDQANQLNAASTRNEVTKATNPKWEYDLSYKKSFEDNKDRSLTASAVGSSFAKDKFSQFVNEGILGDFQDLEQHVLNDVSQAEYAFQSDYVHPFSKASELETGVKYTINDIFNDNELMENGNGVWSTDPSLTGTFNYVQKVLAVYGTYAYELDKFGVKSGVRVEDTNLNTELDNSTSLADQKYTNVFPSVHTSFNFSEEFSVQAGYSRRIHRPRMWDLNPFTSLTDYYNRSTGNPALLPEFTNAFELTAIQNWDLGSISGAIYHRRTSNVMDRVVTVEGNVTSSTIQNLGQSRNTGLELNGSFDPTKWLTILVDGNWVSFQRSGVLENRTFDFGNTRWSGEFTAKIKLPLDIDTEVGLNYRSKVEGVQSVSEDMLYVDFGIKKKFLKGRAVINFSMRDVFSSRKYISESDLTNFYRYSERLRNGSQFVVGLSYGFGKGDAMEFSGHKQF